MIFFPWLFVAFGLGWCVGRLLLSRWWRKRLEQLEASIKEHFGKIEANNAEMLRLIDAFKVDANKLAMECDRYRAALEYIKKAYGTHDAKNEVAYQRAVEALGPGR